MSITRTELIEAARKYVGVPYAHQGRSAEVGLDCGGLLLLMGRDTGISSLEHLGYATRPDGETFERLLDEELDRLPVVEGARKPNLWNAQPGDILAFDWGEGIYHCALITGWSWRFTVIHAIQETGSNRRKGMRKGAVVEAPLDFKMSSQIVRAYRVRGLQA